MSKAGWGFGGVLFTDGLFKPFLERRFQGFPALFLNMFIRLLHGL